MLGAGGIPPEQMMVPHLENIQQMDQGQLEGVLMQLLQMVGPDIATQMAPPQAGKGGRQN